MTPEQIEGLIFEHASTGLNHQVWFQRGEVVAIIKALTKTDMFWDDSDPETCRSSIHEVIDHKWNDGLMGIGDEMEIQQAIRLPNIKVRVIVDPEDNYGFDYEEIKP